MSGLETFHCVLATDDQRVEDCYLCLICQEVMHKPVSLRCGHSSCMACLLNLFEKGQLPSKCPSCRKEIPASEKSNMSVNISLNLLVGKVQIRCSNDGCSWQGDNAHKEHHHQQCGKLLMDCPNQCGFSGTRENVPAHSSVCPLMMVSCDHCQDMIKRMDTASHVKECPEKHRSCPYDCGSLIPRSHVHLHILNCKKRVTRCKVKDCHKAIRQENIEEHNRDDEDCHQKLLNHEIQKLKYASWENNNISVERKEDGIASFQWKVPRFKEGAAKLNQTLVSPAFKHKVSNIRCVLKKISSADYSLFLQMVSGPSPIITKTRFVFKTNNGSTEFTKQAAKLSEGDSYGMKVGPIDNLLDVNGSLDIVVFVHFYYFS